MIGEADQFEAAIEASINRIRTKAESLLNVPVAPPGWLENRQKFQHRAEKLIETGKATAMIFDVKGAKNLSDKEIGACFQQLAEALEQLEAEQVIVRRSLGSDEVVVVASGLSEEQKQKLFVNQDLLNNFHYAAVLELNPEVSLGCYLSALDAALSVAKNKERAVRVTGSPDCGWQVVGEQGEKITELTLPEQEKTEFPCETGIFVETYNKVRNRLKKLVSERGGSLPVVIVDIPNFSEFNDQTQSLGTCVLANIANSLCLDEEEIALVAKLGTMFLVVPAAKSELNLVKTLLEEPMEYMNLKERDLTVASFLVSMVDQEFRLQPAG